MEDLREIRDYIAYVLHAPETARRYLRSMQTQIEKLSYMAGVFAPLDEEPWHSRGVRKMSAGNYFVYYRIDEPTRRVYVLDVIYARRDQLKSLKYGNDD